VSDRNPSPDQQNATPGTPDTPGADTTGLGYDAQWANVRACAAGAPHVRAGLFILYLDSSWSRVSDFGSFWAVSQLAADLVSCVPPGKALGRGGSGARSVAWGAVLLRAVLLAAAGVPGYLRIG